MDRLAIPNSRRICTLSFRRNASAAFTVVELTVVMVLVGIMAAVFAPRFIGLSEFRVATAKNELISITRYAQQAALWRGVGSRVQLVIDGATQELRVEVVDAEDTRGCTGTPQASHPDTPPPAGATKYPRVIRRLPMTEGKAYRPVSQLKFDTAPPWSGVEPDGPEPDQPDGRDAWVIAQFDPLGALDSDGASCPNRVELSLGGAPMGSHGSLCIEPSGYIHEGECYCEPATGEGCKL